MILLFVIDVKILERIVRGNVIAENKIINC